MQENTRQTTSYKQVKWLFSSSHFFSTLQMKHSRQKNFIITGKKQEDTRIGPSQKLQLRFHERKKRKEKKRQDKFTGGKNPLRCETPEQQLEVKISRPNSVNHEETRQIQ